MLLYAAGMTETQARVERVVARYSFWPRAIWACSACGQDVPEDPQRPFSSVGHTTADGVACPQRAAPPSPLTENAKAWREMGWGW